MELSELVRQLRQPHGASRTAEIAAADLLEEQHDQIASLRDKVERLEWRIETILARSEQQ